MRRVLVVLAIAATIGAVTLAGLFAVRLTRAQPAPESPHPKRVVKVNVQPGR